MQERCSLCTTWKNGARRTSICSLRPCATNSCWSSHHSFFLARVCECGWVGVGARAWHMQINTKKSIGRRGQLAWPACSAMVAAVGMLTAVALHVDRARPSAAGPNHAQCLGGLVRNRHTENICVVECVAGHVHCMAACTTTKRWHSTTLMSAGRNAVQNLHCSSRCERLKVYARTCLIAAELTRNAEWRSHDHRKRNMTHIQTHAHARARTHTHTHTNK